MKKAYKAEEMTDDYKFLVLQNLAFEKDIHESILTFVL